MFCKRMFLILLLAAVGLSAAPDETVAGRCMTCHKKETTGLYNQWYESSHALHKVRCIDCHGANKNESDAFEHYDAYIATLVTPKDCGACHEQEADQVRQSYHAQAGKILESQDAYLAHVTAGNPVAIQGCESCHGTKVQLNPNTDNKLSHKSWPNSGIGRINPDGSLGSCNACHPRHSFSKAQARQPEACSKCHLGPDHPQKEVYEESKHGNTYYTNLEKMNLNDDQWVVGEDYFAAPTCATCHMSATSKQDYTHDVGDRLSWTLRPVISGKKDNWQTKREHMKDVCSTCHGSVFVDGHYTQMDATIRLYNDKFAKPALEIISLIKEKELMHNPASFSNDIEWTFWELWHHEGRRARHGSSMMGPDYTWWHGFYEVAQHFYFTFLPQARAYDDPEVNQTIDDLLENDPMHQWLGRSTEALKKEIGSGKMQQVYESYFEAQ
ncbi:MAG: multiheme c-type cytochrome [candidate division KSB1 bacterium]|nr:multiheme c-type cytochrome [candidate division KSB1 bacterium]